VSPEKGRDIQVQPLPRCRDEVNPVIYTSRATSQPTALRRRAVARKRPAVTSVLDYTMLNGKYAVLKHENFRQCVFGDTVAPVMPVRWDLLPTGWLLTSCIYLHKRSSMAEPFELEKISFSRLQDVHTRLSSDSYAKRAQSCPEIIIYVP
jgi:hypothetical protein